MAWFMSIMLLIQPLASDIDIEVIQADAGENSSKHPNNKSQPQSSIKNDRPHLQTVSIESKANQNNKSCSEDRSDRSGPISIPRSEHWRAPKVPETITKAAPVEYLPDGTKVEFKTNEFQEQMPILPKIARPQNTMRQNTRPPGAHRWSLIMGCWMDVDQNTSRGTWGCFKDKRKLIRRPEDCEPGDLGLFAVEPISEEPDAVTTSQSELPSASNEISHSSVQNDISTATERENRSEAAANVLTLSQLRELAMENEDAIESYVPSLGDHIVKRSRMACGPGGCP